MFPAKQHKIPDCAELKRDIYLFSEIIVFSSTFVLYVQKTAPLTFCTPSGFAEDKNW